MRHWTLLLFATVLALAALSGFGRTQKTIAGDTIIGKWVNPDGNRKMEVYKQGNAYFGKITWVKNSDDKAKPGEVVLQNLVYANGKWSGKITAAGKEATCSIILPDAGTMRITGKMGYMSRTKDWKRIG